MLDEILSLRVKWRDFKRSVRYTNAQLRQAFDEQLRESGDFWTRFRWDDPRVVKIVHDGHKLSLDTCQKNFKARSPSITG